MWCSPWLLVHVQTGDKLVTFIIGTLSACSLCLTASVDTYSNYLKDDVINLTFLFSFVIHRPTSMRRSSPLGISWFWSISMQPGAVLAKWLPLNWKSSPIRTPIRLSSLRWALRSIQVAMLSPEIDVASRFSGRVSTKLLLLTIHSF